MPETWDSDKIVRAAKVVVRRNMAAAMFHLQGAVQRKISIGQPVVRSGKALRGLAPSAEGDPPRVLSGKLRTSITHEVTERGDVITGRVGTNLPYGRRLELGFFGTDSMGRNINQGARPYLRPAFRETLPRLVSILTR